jgi:hypothetical protein
MYYSKISPNDTPAIPVRGQSLSQPPQVSVHYRLYCAELKELELHKWLESEKAGYDIGMERARLDWYCKHRAAWLTAWLKENDYLLTPAGNQRPLAVTL